MSLPPPPAHPPGAADFEAARQAFIDGLQAQQGGDLAQAEALYRRSLALLPGRPSTLTNLGVTLLEAGRPAEALPLLQQALAAEPGNAEARAHAARALAALGQDAAALQAWDELLAAQTAPAAAQAAAWFERSGCLARLGRLSDALVSLDRCLQRAPEHAAAWAQRGGLLKDMGRPAEAAEALRRALALGADPALNGYLLAAIEGSAAPPAPPPTYVEQLFDGYAAGFDEHLQRLDYQAPQQLALLLQPHALQRGWADVGAGVPVGSVAGQVPGSRPWASALDLGCGTGQCGPLLRPWVQALHGVDLSSRMLQEARSRGLYDTLHHADIATHLAHTGQRHDLLVAADVCIYLGDLAPLMAGARRVLQPGGLLALSLEAADDSFSFTLRPSARYAHSARYLRTLAAGHGLQLLHLQPGPLRTEQRQPVPGLYVLMRQPLAQGVEAQAPPAPVPQH